ncbi:TIGR02453 family protein [Bacteroidia bacterium]|nr:TIGR02453 family protein [Bacteroidia bacterium]
MIKQVLQFLKELEQNNNREWFHANKERYDVLKKEHQAIVQQLINRITLFDPDIAGLEAKDCLFRIYRDIRFSPNKVPYKTHFGAYMATQGGRSSLKAGYYLHLEPGNCLLSGGLWIPDPKLLKKVRQDIYDHIDEFAAIIEKPSFKAIYPELEGETLKRIPAGFPADFKYEWLLRYKSFCVNTCKPDSFFDRHNWMDQTVACFKELLPFNRFLNYSVDEFQGKV